VDALRYRVRKGEITSRKGNDGRVQVLVGADPAVSAPQPDTSVEIAMLREELAAASSRADRAEGELAGLREALTRADASLEHARQELAEARRGWLERLLEVVRRR
jgi:hypothetical protein